MHSLGKDGIKLTLLNSLTKMTITLGYMYYMCTPGKRKGSHTIVNRAYAKKSLMVYFKIVAGILFRLVNTGGKSAVIMILSLLTLLMYNS